MICVYFFWHYLVGIACLSIIIECSVMSKNKVVLLYAINRETSTVTYNQKVTLEISLTGITHPFRVVIQQSSLEESKALEPSVYKRSWLLIWITPLWKTRFKRCCFCEIISISSQSCLTIICFLCCESMLQLSSCFVSSRGVFTFGSLDNEMNISVLYQNE